MSLTPAATEQYRDLVQTVLRSEVKPHPQNYRKHPADQLRHLIESVREHGFYRPVVLARDNTILAGHGLVLAADELGLVELPAIRLDLDPDDPRALKVLIGDNEIQHLSERDDRQLSELLKLIHDDSLVDLLGTGYDEAMLAALVYVTRPESEITDAKEAAQWVGMPSYEEGAGQPHKITVSFRSAEDRETWAQQSGLEFMKKETWTWSAWWPPKEREDLVALRFSEAERA